METDSGSKTTKKLRITTRFVNLKINLQQHAWQPPTDLYETEDEYTIRIEIAGMKEDDFTVNYSDRIITVFGKRKQINPKCAYHRLEIPYGEFTTSIQLPENINIKQTVAEYENGFLTITIPKTKPVDILIQPSEE